MRAILTFNLNNADDLHSHKLAVSATDMYLALSEIQDFLRSEIKYNCKENYVPLQEKFYEIINERGLNSILS